MSAFSEICIYEVKPDKKPQSVTYIYIGSLKTN